MTEYLAYYSEKEDRLVIVIDKPQRKPSPQMNLITSGGFQTLNNFFWHGNPIRFNLMMGYKIEDLESIAKRQEEKSLTRKVTSWHGAEPAWAREWFPGPAECPVETRSGKLR